MARGAGERCSTVPTVSVSPFPFKGHSLLCILCLLHPLQFGMTDLISVALVRVHWYYKTVKGVLVFPSWLKSSHGWLNMGQYVARTVTFSYSVFMQPVFNFINQHIHSEPQRLCIIYCGPEQDFTVFTTSCVYSSSRLKHHA